MTDTQAFSELSGQIEFSGSSLVAPLVENYFSPAFVSVNPGVSITVQIVGSGAGIQAVGQGRVDIGMSSRPLSQSEIDQYPNLKPFSIAHDSIAIVTHPGISESLSILEVRNIFSGTITNWNQVGGSNMPIIVVSLNEGSSTRNTFEAIVMSGTEITNTAIFPNSVDALRSFVAATPGAIGYLNVPLITGGVNPVLIDGVAPTEINVMSGIYPVFRTFYLITNDPPNQLSEAFLALLFGQQGQEILDDLGYVQAERVSGLINPGGGSLSSPLGDTTIGFPSGAFTATVAFAYSYQIDQNKGILLGIDHSFELTGVYSNTSQTAQIAPGQTFTVTVQYADTEIGQVSERSLALYYWNGTEWIEEPSSTVNETDNTVTVTPNHFSLWSVLGHGKTYLPVVLRAAEVR